MLSTMLAWGVLALIVGFAVAGFVVASERVRSHYHF